MYLRRTSDQILHVVQLYDLHIDPKVHDISVFDDLFLAFNDQAHVAPAPGGMSNTFPAPALLAANSTA